MSACLRCMVNGKLIRVAASLQSSKKMKARLPSDLSAQGLVEVRDQILLVLDPDRQPDDVRAGTGLHLGGVVELAMGGRGGMDHQRAGVADIGKMREQLQVRHQIDAGLIAALEREREDRAGAARRVFAGEVVVLVAGKTR